MPVYLVRTIDEHDLVGIFNAETVTDFVIAIDECTDPEACEYLELPVGGLFWSEPAVQIPPPEGDNDNGPDEDSYPDIPWADVSMAGSWWQSFYSEKDGWLPVSVALDADDLSGFMYDDDPGPEPPKPKLRVVRNRD